MTDPWVDRLSEYLDRELAPADVRMLEAHLTNCAKCQAVLADLRRVVGHAHALDDRPPVTDLWPGIAESIGTASPRAARAARRRFAFSVPQLLAASLVLMIVSGGTVWYGTRHAGASSSVDQIPSTIPAIGSPVAWTNDAPYATAIAQLDSALDEGRKAGRLDTTTIRVLEHNLTIIDSAIAQARRALLADPGSAYLNAHLAETMQRKLQLLRGAASFAAGRT